MSGLFFMLKNCYDNAMKRAIKAMRFVVAIGALAIIGFLLYDLTIPACFKTQSYAIGQVDTRFQISSEEFKDIVGRAEALWETAANRNIFEFSHNGDLIVNLKFDERQERTLAAKKSRETIQKTESTYDEMYDQYEKKTLEYENASQNFQRELTKYETAVEEYNARAKELDESGELSPELRAQLSEERDALEQRQDELAIEQKKLNENVNVINVLTEEINIVASALEHQIEAYNTAYGTFDEFDQGEYIGDSINIYQFNGAQDLELVIAHELGHALGIGHVDDPLAIMHAVLNEQDVSSIHLTQADLEALASVCSL